MNLEQASEIIDKYLSLRDKLEDKIKTLCINILQDKEVIYLDRDTHSDIKYLLKNYDVKLEIMDWVPYQKNSEIYLHIQWYNDSRYYYDENLVIPLKILFDDNAYQTLQKELEKQQQLEYITSMLKK